jgi:hypothetical protein
MLPAEPPHNVGYMVAAYIVAPLILVGYLGSLVRRVGSALGAARRQTGDRAERAIGRRGERANGR